MRIYVATALAFSLTTGCLADSEVEETASLQEEVSQKRGHYKFTTIDYPGFATFTGPIGINDKGDLSGFFNDQSGAMHGYVWKNGKFTQIDFPGSASTWVDAMTKKGELAGTYFDTSGIQHGYIYKDGKFKALNHPDAVPTQGVRFEFGYGLGTAAFQTSDVEQVVGEYADKNANSHSWLYSDGKFSSFDPPGANPAPGGGSSAMAVNDSLEIVGKYIGFAPPYVHSYYLKKGRYKMIDHPSAGGYYGTQANGINDRGDIVGVYSDALNHMHGFVLRDGCYSTLDFPGAVGTELHYLNNKGEITGSYFDELGIGHGFVASPR